MQATAASTEKHQPSSTVPNEGTHADPGVCGSLPNLSVMYLQICPTDGDRSLKSVGQREQVGFTLRTNLGMTLSVTGLLGEGLGGLVMSVIDTD